MHRIESSRHTFSISGKPGISTQNEKCGIGWVDGLHTKVGVYPFYFITLLTGWAFYLTLMRMRGFGDKRRAREVPKREERREKREESRTGEEREKGV